MSEPNELETLTDFVSHDGWRMFGERAQREWGPSGLRFQQAVRDAAEKKEGAAEDLRMILRLQAELLGLIQWPVDRVSQLRNQQKAASMPVSMSRRGPGL